MATETVLLHVVTFSSRFFIDRYTLKSEQNSKSKPKPKDSVPALKDIEQAIMQIEDEKRARKSRSAEPSKPTKRIKQKATQENVSS